MIDSLLKNSILIQAAQKGTDARRMLMRPRSRTGKYVDEAARLNAADVTFSAAC
jgi:hypothetical protein